MAESFGLNCRIEAYTGTRAIGLYSWDLECFTDVLYSVLAENSRERIEPGPEYNTLNRLNVRLRELRASDDARN